MLLLLLGQGIAYHSLDYVDGVLLLCGGRGGNANKCLKGEYQPSTQGAHCTTSHLGCVVMQCSSKCYFKAMHACYKINYFWTRPIKIGYPGSSSLKSQKKRHFHYHKKMSKITHQSVQLAQLQCKLRVF